MLLIHPPLVKPSEPPAGLAKLSGALVAHGISHHIVDANIEGLCFLLAQPGSGTDTWTRRAIKNRFHNIAALRSILTYESPDRYRRAVQDVNRVLAFSGAGEHVAMTLADYRHQSLSPLRSIDLFFAADHPEQNPFYPYFKKRLTDILYAGAIRTAGISLNYLSQALCAFAMIGFIKKEFPNVKIILGGGLVSSWMKRPAFKIFFAGLVDHCIAGPGELPLLDLVNASGPKRTHYQPNYALLPPADYLSPGFILPYSAAQGCCYHRCSFCPETTEGNPYVPVPVHQAIDDLSSLITKTKPVLIHLLDNAVSPALMQGLIDRPLGVPWYGFTRITKEFLGLDFCMQLKQAGCVMLKIGLESGDQEVLDSLRKGTDIAEAAQVLRNLRKAGIAAYVYLLFGTPPENEQKARATLDFIIKQKDAIGFLNIAIFNMPLANGEKNDLATEPFYEGDLSLYTGFKHPHGWDRKKVRLFLDREFKKHPAVSSILKNDPPLFTSNHAAFFAKQETR